MKKILLLTSVALFTICAQAQVIFRVESPAPISGLYNFTYAPADGTWGVSDLQDPINAVIDTLAFANDGTAADSLACINSVGPEVNGKIAVLYRGACNFSTKALNAQNAGAVAVIIINNDGEAIGMAAGTDGASVTIPVVMIGEVDGEVLAEQIRNGFVVTFIGSKLGYYDNDINIFSYTVLRAKQFSNVQRVCQDSTEFTVDIGSWIFNYGANNQTGVNLSASIVLNGDTIYNEVSDTLSIISGDSSYFALPPFAQGSYDLGYYHMDYIATSDSMDEDIQDNAVSADFMMSETEISYAPTDSLTEKPISTNHYRTVSRGLTDEQTFCIHYQNANASRLKVTGISFSAVRSSEIGTPITGELIDVFAYEWTDDFTGLSDPLLTAVNTFPIAQGEYNFTDDLQDTSIYVNFFSSAPLIDNQRYLFCFTTNSDTVYYGMNSDIDYAQNSNTYDQPISPIVGETNAGGSSWFISGFGTDLVPSMSVTTIPNWQVGVTETSNNEESIVPFPNPAQNEINIPFKGANLASISIFDISGKLINTQAMATGSNNLVTVNVTDIPNGVYIFTATFENGNTSNFNVVVSK